MNEMIWAVNPRYQQAAGLTPVPAASPSYA